MLVLGLDNRTIRKRIEIRLCSIPFLSLVFFLSLSNERAATAMPQEMKTEISFNRDIRPILSENCFSCHGFDAENREADLRLDLPEKAYSGSPGEAAIVPGKPGDSLIWQRIMSGSSDEIMPPADSHKKLTETQKETLRKWIQQGANYQKHWAFELPIKPPGDGIDHFVKKTLSAILGKAGGLYQPETRV